MAMTNADCSISQNDFYLSQRLNVHGDRKTNLTYGRTSSFCGLIEVALIWDTWSGLIPLQCLVSLSPPGLKRVFADVEVSMNQYRPASHLSLSEVGRNIYRDDVTRPISIESHGVLR